MSASVILFRDAEIGAERGPNIIAGPEASNII